MTSESELKTQLVRQFKKLGHYGHRIEDKFSVGFPDLILIPQGYPVFFCEAKLVERTKFKPSPRQYVELQRLDVSPSHSIPCVLGFDGMLTYLHPRATICMIDQCTVKRHSETIVDFFKRFYHERYKF